MRKFIIPLMVSLLLALPAAAQTALGETYTTDTGTTIEYPTGWTVEQTDNLIVLSPGTLSRVVLLDYPVVNVLSDGDNRSRDEPLLNRLVALVATEVLDRDIDANAIESQMLNEREMARYDIPMSGRTVGGSVVALRFSNNTVGMLISINVSETLFQTMLETFDNDQPAQNDNFSLDTQVAQTPGAYVFRSVGRFSYPAGWSMTPSVRDAIEYVTLESPEEDVVMLLFDVSSQVDHRAALESVLEKSDLNLERRFGVVHNVRSARRLQIGDHEGLHYRGSAFVGGQVIPAEVTIVRFDAAGIGVVIAYGDLQAQADQVRFIIGSFNNLGALLKYIS